MQRREFLTASSVALLGLAVQGEMAVSAAAAEPIIDIHQHAGYSGRTDAALVAHQRAMGATMTVLLPALSERGTRAGTALRQRAANQLPTTNAKNSISYIGSFGCWRLGVTWALVVVELWS
jgi:hypothetical protein